MSSRTVPVIVAVAKPQQPRGRGQVDDGYGLTILGSYPAGKQPSSFALAMPTRPHSPMT